MAQFISDYLPEVAGIVTMAVWFFVTSFFSIKNSVVSIDKKRVAEGLEPMTKLEKEIISREWKTSTIGDFISALVAGIVALIVTGLFQS